MANTIIPPLLNERTGEVGKFLRDCTYAAGLMAAYVASAGAGIFPQGYTGAEREALERSDTRANETGATLADLDLAMANRYGNKLSKLTTGLATALGQTGTALVIQGNTGNLPKNLQYQSTPVNHAVTVIPLGGGYSNLLDPLSKSTKGVVVPNSTILKFAWGKDYARQVTASSWVTGGNTAPGGGASTPITPLPTLGGSETDVITALKSLGISTDPNHILTELDVWKIRLHETNSDPNLPFDPNSQFYKAYADTLLGKPVSKLLADSAAGTTYKQTPSAFGIDIPDVGAAITAAASFIGVILVGIVLILVGGIIILKGKQ